MAYSFSGYRVRNRVRIGRIGIQNRVRIEKGVVNRIKIEIRIRIRDRDRDYDKGREG